MLLDDPNLEPHLLRVPQGKAPPAAEKTAPSKRRSSHFVEPYRFDTRSHSTLMKVLKREQLGDDPSRRLFVAALEYEIGTFRQLDEVEPEPDPTPVPEQTDPQLARIRKAATTLSALLHKTAEETLGDITGALSKADTFARSYDAAYLRSLRCELDRLAGACQTRLETSAETPRKMSPILQENSRRLLRMLAHAYTECFECRPAPGEQEPFNRVANAVIELAGLHARSDEALLREVLGADPPAASPS